MIALRGRLARTWDAEPFVVRIRAIEGTGWPSHSGDVPVVQREARLATKLAGPDPRFHASFTHHGADIVDGPTPLLVLPEVLRHLGDGDIIRVVPRAGEIDVMYRRSSAFNTILTTERCNSNCLMCSQPPRDRDDDYLVRAILDAIPLMSRQTKELGITGGEPMLLGRRLFEVIEACKHHLPGTALHMLSNGRLFNYLTLARRLAAVEHPDLVVGVPLYSDLSARHDFVVQAKGAFDQTIRGLLNLARCRVRVELRVVIHRQTTDRLPQLARFIARNLPFVEHVALMGLEMMGHVRMNLPALWIDPADYQPMLVAAARELDAARLRFSIYNHQLCVLDRRLWPRAVQSISDWKNEYLPACDACAARAQCGGFFSSAKLRHSDHIHPMSDDDLQQINIFLNRVTGDEPCGLV